ncbi:MAG: hypothetical protein LBH54_06085, partial [Clostridiales bacterium]|nr:hypothetical protein [Clostridiales bacterium]
MKRKRKLFSILLISVFLTSNLPALAEQADSAAVVFADTFDDYAAYGGELPSKRWEVTTDGVTDSAVRAEQDGGNGFAAFRVKTAPAEGGVRSAAVSLKKNAVDNADKTLVYEGSFYAFDTYAKAGLSFTDAGGKREVELLSLRGGELSVRGADGVLKKTATAALRTWNRVSLV